ncbi:MAG: hypothetical protein V4534_09215 [Myxococcota bacterium]
MFSQINNKIGKKRRLQLPGFHTLEVLAFLGIAGGLVAAAIPNYRFLKKVTVASSIHNTLGGLDKALELCGADQGKVDLCTSASIGGVDAVLHPYATYTVTNTNASVASIKALLSTGGAACGTASTDSIVDLIALDATPYGSIWSRAYSAAFDASCKVH